MARTTANLKLYCPAGNEYYDVEKDQNENFDKLDQFAGDTNDAINELKRTKSDITHTHDERYYTETEVDELFKKYCPYSVGDIMLTELTTHPATRWLGTTWIRIVDCTLMGAGNLYAVGSEGGSTTATLKIANMPQHLHTYENSVNWAHTHTYSTKLDWNHRHEWSTSFNWSHTHYYSNSINWSHNHATESHRHWIPTHQHIVPWGERGLEYEYGTHYGFFQGANGNSDYDNNWMYTSPSGDGWSGEASPATTYSGGIASFSGNTGSAGTTVSLSDWTSQSGLESTISGTTSSSGNKTTFSGITTASGNGQAFNILNPYRAVFIWKRTA